MKNDNHEKKLVAPIVITALFLLYLTGYVYAIAVTTEFNPLFLLLAIPMIALGIGMIYVLRTRIKEIESGEEDDLGNY